MIRRLEVTEWLLVATMCLGGAGLAVAADRAAGVTAEAGVGVAGEAGAEQHEPLEKLVVPPHVAVASVSQGSWSVRWWKWAASFLREDSPVADLSGRLCGNGQEGPIWFLAGTYESRLVTRRCTVPRGKYIFFPLINYIVAPASDGSVNCNGTTLAAKKATDDPELLVAQIDGVSVPGLSQYRQVSPRCFDLAARARAEIAIGATAANGYYLMLYPLAPGHHALRFGGRLSNLTQAVSYELTIE